jgi:drug/metabolite transporter (DMT)-like permease
MTPLYTWGSILLIVLASTTGDILMSHVMKRVGDVHSAARQCGFLTVLRRILGNPLFFVGIVALAVAFYALLFGLSWNDVSLIGPAAAALTFVTNAIAAKIFLHERVDRRRWIAALLIAGGVVLLAV